jgi:hypothetical protein
VVVVLCCTFVVVIHLRHLVLDQCSHRGLGIVGDDVAGWWGVSRDGELGSWAYLPHIHYRDFPCIVVVALHRSHVAIEDLG